MLHDDADLGDHWVDQTAFKACVTKIIDRATAAEIAC